MKRIRVADNKEIIITKYLFFDLAQELYFHTKLAIEHADSRLEALELLRNYLQIENCIKTECRQNGIGYKRYTMGQGEKFTDFIDEKFPIADELKSFMEDGQVPF
ncbi:MAG: hypothetical protein K2G88_09515 [Oscillospiraceae bacterium]|nr:hypothetical protein [Oscillospiraceae bacterium]